MRPSETIRENFRHIVRVVLFRQLEVIDASAAAYPRSQSKINQMHVSTRTSNAEAEASELMHS